MKNYWDYLSSNGQTYQMGAQSHRVYLLDLLKERGIHSILDVGAGTAPIYQLIRDTKMEGNPEKPRWDFAYKGTDYSEGMIDVCKNEFPEAEFEVQDARKLLEKDHSWDCVLLMHCLDHLDDYQSAINEAARVAKKYVLIVLWRGFTNSGQNNLNDRNDFGRDDGGHWEDTHLQDYSKERLLEAFQKAGLKLEFETSGVEINHEGKNNTLFLLSK
jgi:ubiquinone/menaquinone biosynthesis C-methylase UbiE